MARGDACRLGPTYRLAAALVVPVPVEFEAVALVLYVGGVRRREVRRHQERALLDAIGQQGVTALAGEIAVLAEAAVPLPQRHLHGIVQGVAGEDGALALRVEIEADLARRVTGRRLQGETAAHAVLTVGHELGLPGL